MFFWHDEQLGKRFFSFHVKSKRYPRRQVFKRKLRLVIVHFIKMNYFAIMWFSCFLQCLHEIWLVVSIFYYCYSVFKNSIWIAELDFFQLKNNLLCLSFHPHPHWWMTDRFFCSYGELKLGYNGWFPYQFCLIIFLTSFWGKCFQFVIDNKRFILYYVMVVWMRMST